MNTTAEKGLMLAGVLVLALGSAYVGGRVARKSEARNCEVSKWRDALVMLAAQRRVSNRTKIFPGGPSLFDLNETYDADQLAAWEPAIRQAHERLRTGRYLVLHGILRSNA